MSGLKQYYSSKQFKSNESIQAYFHDETYDYTPLHTHDFFELNIVMSGNGKHFINTTDSYIVTAGDVFIIPPQISHGYVFDSKQYSIFHLLFHHQFFQRYESCLSNIVGYQILFNIDPQLRKQNNLLNNFLHVNLTENYNLVRIFNELSSLQNEEKQNTESKKEYLALYVIARICEIIEEEKATYNGNKRYLFELLKSIEYIHQNFHSKIELETLYSISCMSRSSYIRYFKQFFNCTPIDYIQDYRLRQSKSMLKYTSDSLTLIANNCGFCDSAHFSRLFKQKYQISPSKYRNNFNNQNEKQ